MHQQQSAETDALYARGLELFGMARWEDAAKLFSELKGLSSAYPEVDHLLADAMLKIELERGRTAADSSNKPQRKLTPLLIVGAVVIVLLTGGAAAYLLSSAPPADTAALPIKGAVGVLPTAAPTFGPTATVAPAVAPTVAPTAQTGKGQLLVRMAEGQKMLRPAQNLYIILDASGSMLADIDGQRKIDVAHESLNTLLKNVPDNTNVALRTYGRRRAGDCNDIELVSPLAPLNRADLENAINSIIPVNYARTPIGLSLEQIPADLKNASGDTLVLLVSDGDETCDSDPAKVAGDLHTANSNLRISVIGFKIGPDDWRGRLTAIAERGNGDYYEANDAAQLANALQRAITPVYRVLDASGHEVETAEVGGTLTLESGSYSLELVGGAKLGNVIVEPNKTTVVEVQSPESAKAP